jgi:hypothetical protein
MPVRFYDIEDSLPLVLGTTTTERDGRFRLAIPGSYNQKYLSVAFNGTSKANADKRAGWRIVDLRIDQKQ